MKPTERKSVRKVLAENLKTLMQRTISLDTQVKVAKRAGLAQTTISNMLRPASTALEAPKLDNVEKVAGAFGLATWQLLLDREAVGPQMSDLLLRPSLHDVSEQVIGLDQYRKISRR